MVVRDLRQAQVITDRTQLRRLAPFMGQENTVGGAAAQLGLSVTATYKIVQRFLAQGLLHGTRRQSRAGRATRYYGAPAEFFVPFSVLGLEQIGERNRQIHLERFNRNLSHTLRRELPPGWGSRTGVLPSGERYYSISSPDRQVMDQRADDAPLIVSGWNLVKLSPQEAHELQRRVLELFEPYFTREGDGDTYLTGIFLVRDYEF